jgi:hypothetical protein
MSHPVQPRVRPTRETLSPASAQCQDPNGTRLRDIASALWRGRYGRPCGDAPKVAHRDRWARSEGEDRMAGDTGLRAVPRSPSRVMDSPAPPRDFYSLRQVCRAAARRSPPRRPPEDSSTRPLRSARNNESSRYAGADLRPSRKPSRLSRVGIGPAPEEGSVQPTSSEWLPCKDSAVWARPHASSPRVASLSRAESHDVHSTFAGLRIGAVATGCAFPAVIKWPLRRVGDVEEGRANDGTRPGVAKSAPVTAWARSRCVVT